MYSAMSVAGVIGYPANTRHPAAIAPSVSAYVPASNNRRPCVHRRSHSVHGATSPSFSARVSVLMSVLGSILHCDVNTKIRTDLVAQHAADAVLLVSHVHRKPPELVGRGAIREDVDGAHVQAEPARLAHLLADHHVPAPGRPPGRDLLSLEQRHRVSPRRSGYPHRARTERRSSPASGRTWTCAHDLCIQDTPLPLLLSGRS